MATASTTYTVADAKLNREDLSDIISQLTPEDTPIYSSIGKSRCKATKVEWGVDDLDAVKDNAHPDGDEWAYTKPTTAVRRINYTQIFRKSFTISGSQTATRSAGGDAKVARELRNKLIELRKDVEASLLLNNGAASGATRKSASLNAWLETNAFRGGGAGADGGWQSDGLVDAATNGTLRAFTKALLDSCMTSVYENGGNPSRVFCTPFVKTVFSKFLSDANVTEQRTAAPARRGVTINAAVDMYLDPQGQLVSVMPDRVMVAGDATLNAKMNRNVFVIDRRRAEWCWLRPMGRQPNIPRTGDHQPVVVLGEGCLLMRNEKAHGLVADVKNVA